MLAAVLLSAVVATRITHAPPPDDELWFGNGHLTRQGTQLIAVLHDAETYGLEPRDYRLPPTPTEQADAKGRNDFNIALSSAATRFIHDLHIGRVDARLAGFKLPDKTPAFDANQILRQLASGNDVGRVIESFEPSPAPYQRLKIALARYRELAEDRTLTQLPPLPAPSIANGDFYAGAPALRRLLAALGDIASAEVPANTDANVIDADLASGIGRFQQRHGLQVDGVIGRRTFDALTAPLSKRVSQIELAMERWRWLTPLGRPDIVVNIPQFTLFALPRASGEDLLEMSVIVGQAYPRTRTPVFATRITQVIFQPYWDVPRSILLRELLPVIRQNPAYLQKHDMEIVRGETDNSPVIEPSPAALEALAAGQLRLRQRPGPLNALGPVKFSMPNPYTIYLHGTPEQSLFNQPQRTFSHGCIRVSEPAELAAYVLRNARAPWDQAAIDAALCGTRTLRVMLEKPVSVIVLYSTAVATRSEGVRFFDDPYGYDQKLQRLLDARP